MMAWARLSATVIALGLLTLASASVSAQRAPETAPPVVVAGIPVPWPPYYGLDRSGEPEGFAIEVMNALASRAGISVTYRVFEGFGAIDPAIDAGEIDLVPNSGITPARSEAYLFTRPVDVTALSVFVRRENTTIHSPSDLAGHAVAVTRTNYARELLRGREEMRLVVHREPETLLWELLSGQVDAAVYPESVFMRMARLAGVDERIRVLEPALGEVRRAIRIRKDRPDLQAALDAEIPAFLASEEYRRIYARWFGAPMPYWTASRVAWWAGGVLALAIVLLIAWRFQSVMGLNRDLRRMNSALAESEGRFRTLMDVSPDSVVVHQEGVIVYANASAVRLLGYEKPEDMLGMAMLDAVVPEEREAVLDRRKRRDAGEQFGLIEGRNLRRDGTAVDVERSSVVTTWQGRPAHLLVLRDISARKAALAERERFFEALDHLPDAVALFDEEERFVAWNRRFVAGPPEVRAMLRRGVSFESYLRGRAALGDLPEEFRDDPDRWIAERLELFRDHEGPVEIVLRGEWRQVRHRRLPDGSIVLISSDISVLKEREQALRQSEARLRSIFEAGGNGIVVVDLKGGYEMANRAFCELTGYSEDELREKNSDDLALPEEREIVKERVRRLVAGEIQSYQIERRYLRKDGTARWALVTARAVDMPDSDGRKFVGIVQDITDRKRAEEALQVSEARFRSVFEAGGAGVNLIAGDGRYLAVNPAFCQFIGYSREELLQMGPLDLAPPEERGQVEARMRMLFSGERRVYRLERSYVHKSGRRIWGTTHISTVAEPDDSLFAVAIIQDITDRKEAEEALALSEARFRDFAEAASDSLWEMDSELRYTWFAGRADPLADIPVSDRIGHFRWEFADSEDAEQNAAMWAAHRADLQARRPFRNFEYGARNARGERRYLSISGKPIFDSDGAFQGYRGTAADITDRVNAMAEIRRLIDAIEAMSEGVLLLDPDDRILYSNVVFRQRNQALEDHFSPGTPFRDFLRAFGAQAAGDAGTDEWLARRMQRHDNPSGQFEMRALDGTPLLVTEKRLADGGTLIVATDITALKRTEEQLAQSQKMEAVGQLTGGVAHDFNNLLTVVLGNLNLLRERFEQDSPENRMIQPAIRAAERGATLTGRLLAFSRRQTLSPSVVNVGKVISDMTTLLRRVLGENIEIETVIDGGLWRCEVDPLQLENALLNMALNARDAMPEGGKLTIEAGNSRLDDNYAAAQVDVAPGQYVVISVTDTGVGMPPEVRGRVFDPFFTTKEVGRGMSMVYGFVKQSGGHIAVYSEVGEGTTFKIYLPRVMRPTERLRADPGTGNEEAGNGETVLLVEDDADVRALAVTMLAELGYRVLDADSAQGAIELLEGEPDIDLLLTDVVLPGGISGRQLAETLTETRPGLPVLYMSGYTENAIIHHGRLDDGIQLLQKPFRKRELQRKVRMALDRDVAD